MVSLVLNNSQKTSSALAHEAPRTTNTIDINEDAFTTDKPRSNFPKPKKVSNAHRRVGLSNNTPFWRRMVQLDKQEWESCGLTGYLIQIKNLNEYVGRKAKKADPHYSAYRFLTSFIKDISSQGSFQLPLKELLLNTCYSQLAALDYLNGNKDTFQQSIAYLKNRHCSLNVVYDTIFDFFEKIERYDVLEKLCSETIKEDLNIASPYFYLINCWYRVDKYAEIITFFESSQKKLPGTAYRGVGLAYAMTMRHKEALTCILRYVYSSQEAMPLCSRILLAYAYSLNNCHQKTKELFDGIVGDPSLHPPGTLPLQTRLEMAHLYIYLERYDDLQLWTNGDSYLSYLISLAFLKKNKLSDAFLYYLKSKHYVLCAPNEVLKYICHYYNAGHKEEALVFLLHALEYDPKDETLWCNLNLLIDCIFFKNNTADKDVQIVASLKKTAVLLGCSIEEQLAQLSLECHPTDNYRRYLLGILAFSQKKFSIARKFLQQAAQHQPKNIQIKMCLAAICHHCPNDKKTTAAFRLYEDVLKTQPDDWFIYDQIISFYLEQQEYQKSLELIVGFLCRQHFPKIADLETISKVLSDIGIVLHYLKKDQTDSIHLDSQLEIFKAFPEELCLYLIGCLDIKLSDQLSLDEQRSKALRLFQCLLKSYTSCLKDENAATTKRQSLPYYGISPLKNKHDFYQEAQAADITYAQKPVQKMHRFSVDGQFYEGQVKGFACYGEVLIQLKQGSLKKFPIHYLPQSALAYCYPQALSICPGAYIPIEQRYRLTSDVTQMFCYALEKYHVWDFGLHLKKHHFFCYAVGGIVRDILSYAMTYGDKHSKLYDAWKDDPQGGNRDLDIDVVNTALPCLQPILAIGAGIKLQENAAKNLHMGMLNALTMDSVSMKGTDPYSLAEDCLEKDDLLTHHPETTPIVNRHQNIHVFNNNMSDDYQTRDFTINAIYYDFLDNVIYDPANGIEAISHKILKLVKSESIYYNRSLAMRFLKYSLLNYQADVETIQKLRINADIFWGKDNHFYKELLRIAPKNLYKEKDIAIWLDKIGLVMHQVHWSDLKEKHLTQSFYEDFSERYFKNKKSMHC